jgi:hypothetical protein
VGRQVEGFGQECGHKIPENCNKGPWGLAMCKRTWRRGGWWQGEEGTMAGCRMGAHSHARAGLSAAVAVPGYKTALVDQMVDQMVDHKTAELHKLGIMKGRGAVPAPS